ncbi:MAG: UDP-N-acetylglucosamine--N-acetylmuramyl-(pentapeptide) pyrophosphoryl-undecaprenol N-acetylglucosamine transferase [Thermotogota bacterium]
MKTKKIIIAGGGTGGHYYPALAFIKYLEKFYKLDILYFITKNRIEEKKIPVDIPSAKTITLETKGLKRPLYKFENISRINDFLKESRNIKKTIKVFDPDFGFFTGGYITAPVILAMKKLKIPFYLHEQNSIPGLVNKRFSKNSTKTFESFENTPYLQNTIYTGNPVRFPDKNISRNLLKNFGIKDLSQKTLLVMGGSLGSKKIDDIMYKVYKETKSMNFIHITKDKDRFENFKNVKTYDYIDNTYEIMTVVDGIISRAGATSIAEIIFYKLNAVLIPWKGAAENHQLINAKKTKELVNSIICDEDRYSINSIIEFLNNINSKPADYIWKQKSDESVKKITDYIEQLH